MYFLYFIFISLCGASCIKRVDDFKEHTVDKSEQKRINDIKSDIKLETKIEMNKERNLFSEFIRKYNRKYKPDELDYRIEIFKQNINLVKDMNKKSRSAIFGITSSMDVPQNETINQIPCLRYTEKNKRSPGISKMKHMRDAPVQWDWRDQLVVTPPGTQGTCLACWAFAANSIIESQHAIKFKNLTQLSVQQFLDCSEWQNHCRGGNVEEAIEQADLVGGVVSSVKYPYKGKKGRCWVNRKDVVTQVIRANRLQIKDEEVLKKYVYNNGPVAAGIVNSFGFTKYKRGVAYSEDLGCDSKAEISRAVVIVGYGETKGHPYWIIQNSEGTDWGEGGYMYLHRGGNDCKIMNYLVEAIVEKA